jgi:hypothetical protein
MPDAVPAGQNALWGDDFAEFASRDKYYWDGKDTKWVFPPAKFRATPKAGGGLVCASTVKKGGSSMSHIWPYAAEYRFFQVSIRANEGRGYAFINVGFGSPSGKPGYRGAVNTSRPGIYTVDTHYIHESFRTGTATRCFTPLHMTPGREFTLDWVRLVKRPENGLAATLADGAPLPASLKHGDELLFHVLLAAPATDVTVDVLANHSYVPLQINGEPYVQLAKVTGRAEREWSARVTLGEGTGTYDQTKSGYPVVFRAAVSGGAIRETYASAFVSFE